MTENLRERGMDFAFLSTLAQESTTASPALALTGAAAVSAAGLALLMKPGTRGVRAAGSVLALAGFAVLAVEVLKRATLANGVSDGAALIPPVFPVIFGLISALGAVRMITHPRPVFAAIYFMLVVISTACMFLLLGAEFMAFALVIVYAGAILITYLFVLMLAQQSPTPGSEASYDKLPREALSSVFIGFVILATLSDVYFSARGQAFIADSSESSQRAGMVASWQRLDAMPKLLTKAAQNTLDLELKNAPADSNTLLTVREVMRDSSGVAITMHGDVASVQAKLSDDTVRTLALPDSAMPVNSQQVGVELVSKFPAGLEIAGVVLLMALFGAVILARKQIELGEDERRELAGMRRMTVDGEAGGSGGAR